MNNFEDLYPFVNVVNDLICYGFDLIELRFNENLNGWEMFFESQDKKKYCHIVILNSRPWVVMPLYNKRKFNEIVNYYSTVEFQMIPDNKFWLAPWKYPKEDKCFCTFKEILERND